MSSDNSNEKQSIPWEDGNMLKAILGAMEGGLTVQDLDYNIIYQNQFVTGLFGDCIGQKCYQAYEGKDEVCEGCPVESAYKDGESHTSVREVKMPDGKIAFWENTANPIRNETGEIIACLEIAKNITGSKLTEEELSKSEENIRLLLNSTVEGIYGVDLHGLCTFANPACVDILGYDDVSQLLGKNMHTLIHHTRKDGTPYPEEECKIFEAFRERRSTNVRDEVLWRCDGTSFPAQYRSSPITVDDDVLGTVVTFVDITERIKSEEALRESERKYRMLTENSTDVIWSSDNNLRTTYLSPSATLLTGYSVEESMKMKPEEIYTPESFKIVMQTMMESLALESDDTADPFRSMTVEAQMLRKDGSAVWTELTATFLRDQHGKVTGMHGITRDVSERKKAEQERLKMEAQMQHTQKLESLGVLAGGIAHDFNNLLTSILGNADLALFDLPATSGARSYIEDLVKASQRAADLCKQMLAYSGKGKFVIQTIDLSDVVEEMSHILEVSISKGAVLKYNFGDNLPFISVDVTQVRQIILNLITNASEAIGSKSGVISITTGAMDCDSEYLKSTFLDEELPEGTYVFIEVADTGCGMDDETATKIFDPFFTTKFTGRGLGLAATLGIVRGHKGAIKVYSELGKGTSIKVIFPASEKEIENGKQIMPKEKAWSGEGTILLVDDEETVRAVGKKMLINFGFEVLTATDGRNGVEIFSQHKDKIICVILDLTMPHMNGEEAFREIRRLKKDVKVIISSGYNEQEVSQRFVGKGIAGFIQKPYRAKTFLNEIIRVLDSQE